MRRILVHLGVVGAALFLTACAPTLNWRQVYVGADGVQAYLPCKPERATREVAVQPPPAPVQTLHVLACETGGARFAVAWLALAADQDAAQWAQQWRRASAMTLGLTPEALKAQPWTVRHARFSHRWQGLGQAQGVALPVRWGWAATKGQLIQLAAYGRVSDAAVETFWQGLSLPAER
jgi:hypothetical protein